MRGKAVSGLMLTLLLTGVLPSLFNLQPAEAAVSPYSPAGGIKLNPPSMNYTSSSYCHYNNTKFDVTVIITNITGCAAYQLWINYNSTLLALDSWSFDTDPANPLSPTQMAPAPSGRIDSDYSILGSLKVATVWKAATPLYTYSGDSVAARLTFQIIYCPLGLFYPANNTVSTSIAFDITHTKAVDTNGNDIFFATFSDSYYEYTTTPVFGSHILEVHSSPPGVTFTVNGVPHTTPWLDWRDYGSTAIVVMPETHDGYDWKSWSGGFTNRTLTCIMYGHYDLTALYQIHPVARAEYDYYVVAGYNMTPTLPPPAPQPDGFAFTLEGFAENGTGLHSLGTGGYDFGSITGRYDPFSFRYYLYEGDDGAMPTGKNWNAYVVVKITNNLGYTITIEDLTAEVTDGTPKGCGLPGGLWESPFSGENLANCSMVALDTFDPWDCNSIDEVDYYSGEVHQLREDDYPDHYWATTGVMRPSRVGGGPGSLLLNDCDGDAILTGHVPSKYGGSAITLAAGATFTEYFGLNVLGYVAVGTQINATVTMRLYYSPPPEGEPAVIDLQMSNLQPLFPAVLKDTTYVYPEWGNIVLNVTLQNLGNLPTDVTVNLYYSKDGGTTWVQIGFQSILNLFAGNGQLFTFYWNVETSNLSIGWTFLKANATATHEALTATCEYNVQVRTVLTGNADGDDDVDVGDQRKVQLAMFSNYPQQQYIDWNNADAFGPQIFTDMDGDLDVDVGDQRKQQLLMFDSDPTEPKT